jgi:hypothetical protein
MYPELPVFQMGLQKYQRHPFEEEEKTIFSHVVNNRVVSSHDHFTDRVLKDVAHVTVASVATWDLIASVTDARAIGQHYLLVMQVVSPKDPVWKNVFVVERQLVATRTADETAIA